MRIGAAPLSSVVEFSLVTTHIDDDSFEMHPLLQLSTRKWLEEYGEIDQRREETLHILSERFPSGEYVNWKTCEDLEPHAQTLLGYSYVPQHCQLERAEILHNSARYALARGNYRTAEARVLEAVDIRGNLIGHNHSCTLSSLRLLASVLQDQGKYEAAEEMNRRALEGREKVLGVEHPSTLTSVSNLASVLRNQGKYEAAEEMNRQALEGREKVLGVEHPSTLTSVYNLAYLFHHQQRYNDASILYLRASAGFSKALGADHPTTQNCSYHYLSVIREMQGEGRDV